MAPSETATGIYITPSLFITASTPGTFPATLPTSSRSLTLPTLPCSVTTNEQELTLITDVPLPLLPSAPRTSCASSASLAGRSAFAGSAGTLLIRVQPRHQGKPPVAHPPLVERLLELGLAGEPELSRGRGRNEGGEVLSLRGRKVLRVAFPLPLEEPYAPRERDEDAAGLGAGDLPLPPVDA